MTEINPKELERVLKKTTFYDLFEQAKTLKDPNVRDTIVNIFCEAYKYSPDDVIAAIERIALEEYEKTQDER